MTSSGRRTILAPAPIASLTASCARRRFPSASPTAGAICAHAIRTLVTDPGLPRPLRHVKITHHGRPRASRGHRRAEGARRPLRRGRGLSRSSSEIAERGRDRPCAGVDELRRKARAAGFSHAEHARGGRRPRPLACSARWRSRRSPARRRTGSASPSSTAARPSSGRSLTPEQRERCVAPDPARRVPRGLGGHRARRRLGRERRRRDGRARRRRVGAERREVVRDERGRPGLLHRARGRRRRADALHRRARARPGLEITRVRRASCTTPTSTTIPRSSSRDCRVPEENRVPAGGNEGAKEWFLVERLFIAARCCGAAERARSSSRATGRWSARPSARRSPSTRASRSSSPTRSTELLAARLLTYHAAHAFDAYEDRKVVHGKVAMAKLYASEAAGPHRRPRRSRSSAAAAT